MPPWDWNNNEDPDSWFNNSNDPRFNNFGNNMNFPAPRNPPPMQTPRRPVQPFGGPAVRAVNPASIRNCRGRFTYIWLRNGQEFWFFPVQIWGNSIAGFRWDRRFGWSYMGISLFQIALFTCSI